MTIKYWTIGEEIIYCTGGHDNIKDYTFVDKYLKSDGIKPIMGEIYLKGDANSRSDLSSKIVFGCVFYDSLNCVYNAMAGYFDSPSIDGGEISYDDCMFVYNEMEYPINHKLNHTEEGRRLLLNDMVRIINGEDVLMSF